MRLSKLVHHSSSSIGVPSVIRIVADNPDLAPLLMEKARWVYANSHSVDRSTRATHDNPFGGTDPESNYIDGEGFSEG